MLFTHFGLSGPAILQLRPVCRQRTEKATRGQTPHRSVSRHQRGRVISKDAQGTERRTEKALKNALKPWMQERYLLFLLERNGLDPQTSFTELPKDQFRAFVKDCKQFTVAADGTLSLDKAFVTGGGVSVKEIEPKQMASKKWKAYIFAEKYSTFTAIPGLQYHFSLCHRASRRFECRTFLTLALNGLKRIYLSVPVDN
ncbi:NAD(P)/FAD-dependent oxidoreductase [Bacillus velezensis]|nr:NAD(P)/FAD-dependent oxidoreductase [Bacillus velezensis]